MSTYVKDAKKLVKKYLTPPEKWDVKIINERDLDERLTECKSDENTIFILTFDIT